MESHKLSSTVAEEATRMAQAAEGRMDAPVPSCPEWTMRDLITHVVNVYDHKTECMRNGQPESWPPERDPQIHPLTQLRRTLGSLLVEFNSRDPLEETYTWNPFDQTVAFWIRRMAHESLIHRVDAEQAAETPLSEIPAELASDGVDELLSVFLVVDSRQNPDSLSPTVAKLMPRPVGVTAGAENWLVTPSPEGIIDVTLVDSSDAAATIVGDPDAVLLWLWRRAGDDTVRFEGDESAARNFRKLLEEFTQ